MLNNWIKPQGLWNTTRFSNSSQTSSQAQRMSFIARGQRATTMYNLNRFRDAYRAMKASFVLISAIPKDEATNISRKQYKGWILFSSVLHKKSRTCWIEPHLSTLFSKVVTATMKFFVVHAAYNNWLSSIDTDGRKTIGYSPLSLSHKLIVLLSNSLSVYCFWTFFFSAQYQAAGQQWPEQEDLAQPGAKLTFLQRKEGRKFHIVACDSYLPFLGGR